jgi:predicted alpha/beta-hydrolase family hydrolase
MGLGILGADQVSRPTLLLAPGAGAPSTSPWMERWARRLAALGQVLRFDYPYVEEGRGRPDRLPVLVAAHARALARARGAAGGAGGPVFLVGKSMGSRVGCHLALAEEVSGLVCLGYPLRGARGDLRDRVLLDLRRPILFVQGTRDRLCPLEELEQVRRRMAAPSELHVVEGGDHSLEVGVRTLRASGLTQDEVDGGVLEAIGRFIGGRAR